MDSAGRPFELETDLLILRHSRPDDAEHAVRWKTDPLIRRMALDPDHATTEEQERADIERALGSDMQLYLIVVARESDRPIGYIRINWQDPGRSVAWLRFALGERRGEGHATTALRCLFAHLFAERLHRVEAEIYDFNAASLAVLEKLGFVREGLKRRAVHDGEEWRDMICLGLLRDDFAG